MLLGKNNDDLFVFFLFITCFENRIIKLPTWTKCAIFWSFYMCNTQRLSSSFFLRPALKPSLPDKHTLHPFLLQHSESSRRIHLLQVVQAAAGGHLSKYITVIWLKTKDEWNKNVLLTNKHIVSLSFVFPFQQLRPATSFWGEVLAAFPHI